MQLVEWNGKRFYSKSAAVRDAYHCWREGVDCVLIVLAGIGRRRRTNRREKSQNVEMSAGNVASECFIGRRNLRRNEVPRGPGKLLEVTASPVASGAEGLGFSLLCARLAAELAVPAPASLSLVVSAEVRHGHGVGDSLRSTLHLGARLTILIAESKSLVSSAAFLRLLEHGIEITLLRALVAAETADITGVALVVAGLATKTAHFLVVGVGLGLRLWLRLRLRLRMRAGNGIPLVVAWLATETAHFLVVALLGMVLCE